MVNWYYNFITHRNLQLEINGTTVTKTVCIGFPQGGVCSVKFWIIAFNEAIEIINSYGAFGNGGDGWYSIALHLRYQNQSSVGMPPCLSHWEG